LKISELSRTVVINSRTTTQSVDWSGIKRFKISRENERP
jgi:hypothetical protein